MQKIRFAGNARLNLVIAWVAVIAFVSQLIEIFLQPLNWQASVFTLLFGAITVIILFLYKRSFTVCFLLSTFTMVVAWRLSALDQLTITVYIYLLAVLLNFINYLVCAYHNITAAKQTLKLVEHCVTAYEWQLLLIRLLIGLILVPHFSEKLFAGSAIRFEDIKAFIALGVAHPAVMVFIAGCTEFFCAFTISCGLLTRFGAITLTIYLLVATYLGNHFSNGFIWASIGGGWEYPALWSMLALSFATFGAGDFSLDRILKDNYRVPSWIKYLMGGRNKIYMA